MRCPTCSTDDDKVVDSRSIEAGGAIRRRRECLSCGARFTTFERVEELPLTVHKRSGEIVPFSRDKLISGLSSAGKNRLEPSVVAAMATDIEEHLRLSGNEVSSEEIGLAVLDRLRTVDEVAYLRFASVYKGFDGIDDFRREVTLLKKSATNPDESGSAGD